MISKILGFFNSSVCVFPCEPGTSRTMSRSKFSKDAGGIFTQTVLSWRVEDIRRKSIYDTSIQRIPAEFPDLHTYCNSFHLHILEEMRSTLKKEIDEKDFSLSCAIEYTKQTVASTITLKPSIHSCELGIFYHQSQSQSLLPNSTSFLTKIQREKLDPIVENGLDCVWLCDFFYAHSSESQDFERSLDDGGKSLRWSLILLDASLTPFVRICNALSNLSAQRSLPASRIQKELLTALANSAEGTDPDPSATVLSPMASKLNESQRLAICRCVRACGAGLLSAIQVVHGPPGTGKTATLVALLSTLLTAGNGKKRRVWVAAPTNQAICEVARRACRDLVLDQNSNVEPFELVLIGDESRLVFNGPSNLKLLHLDSRVERLLNAQTSWNGCLSAIRAFNALTLDPRQSAQATPASKTFDVWDQALKSLLESCSKCIESARVVASEIPLAALPTAARLAMKEAAGVLVRFVGELKTILSVPNQQQFELVGAAHSRLMDRLKLLTGRVHLRSERKEMREMVLTGARVLFSTVSTAGSLELQRLKHDNEDFVVDMAVVDEATQLVEASTAIMLSPGLGCLVLAGDHKQLPPTVISRLAQDFGYGQSLFDRLLSNPGSASSLLNTQYRMHPMISSWPNQAFYKGALMDGPNVLSREYTKPWHEFFPPVSVFNVHGKEEIAPSGSRFNKLEVEVAVKLLKAFYRLFAKAAAGTIKVGLLSPYSAQRELMEQQVSDAKGEWSNSKLEVRVNTVDGFQGQECDIVFFLAVRCNQAGSLGFLTDFRRLNVAVTRARFSLVVICDVQTLKADSLWKSFLDRVESDKRLFSCQNHDLLKRVLQSCNKTVSLDFAGCKWRDKVSFVTNFMNVFKQKNELERRRIFGELLRISEGKWPKAARSCFPGANSDLEGIIFVSSFGATNIIFSIDLQNRVSDCSRRLRDYFQVIMIWDCVTSDKVALILRRISERYRLRSSTWLDMCRRRDPFGAPLCWSDMEPFDHNAPPETVEDAVPVIKEEVGQSLELVKSYALNTLHARILMGCSASNHVELPHNVSAEENFLINFVGSLFVIGRSGTGNWKSLGCN